MATAIAVRNNRERELVQMAERNAAARSRRATERANEDAEKKRTRQIVKNVKAAASENQTIALASAAAGALGGGALQTLVIDEKIDNVYLRRGLVPVGGLVLGGGALMFLDGTPAAAVGGAAIGAAIGSAVIQLAEYLAA